MKALINILLLLFSLTAYKCYAQKKDGELILLLKHGYKIDSLLIGIAKDESSFLSTHPYFSIRFEKNDSSTFVNIYSYNKIEVNAIMVTAHSRQEHLGYFKLKNYIVFVQSSQKIAGLISETKIFKRFDFIDFSRKIEVQNPSGVPIIPYLANFIYQNGKFMPMYGAR